MESYVGIKQVEAKPMARGEYNSYRGWTLPADEDGSDAGYLVRYPDGYESWCPQEQFDTHNTRYDDDGEGVAEVLDLLEDVLDIRIIFHKDVRELYKVYGSVTDFKNFRGEPMPTFDELPAKIQEAWQAVADA